MLSERAKASFRLTADKAGLAEHRPRPLKPATAKAAAFAARRIRRRHRRETARLGRRSRLPTWAFAVAIYSDLEARFVCKARGEKGADVRPGFNWNKPAVAAMGWLPALMAAAAYRASPVSHRAGQAWCDW